MIAAQDYRVRAFAARHIDMVVLTPVALTAVVLRCWRLGDRCLWFDEAFSWRLSTFGWGEVIDRAALDNHPPLYFLLLKLWTVCFGASAVAMRSLSVVAGAAACVAVYLFLGEAYRPCGSRRSLPPGQASWTALLAAALVAVSVLQIRWSWEVRMYSLGALLAVLSSWLLVRALHAAEGALGRWVVYALAALAFAYTHTFALFSLAAQAVYAAGWLFVRSRGHRRLSLRERMPFRGAKGDIGACIGPWVAALVIVAGYAPWLGVLTRQHQQVREKFWIVPLSRNSLPHAATQLFVDPMVTAGDEAGWFYAVACAVAVAALAFRPLAADALVCLLAVVPISMAAAVSACDTPIFYPRYFVFAQLFLLAALARLVGRASGRPERWILAVVVVGNFLMIDCDFFTRLRVNESGGLRAAAKSIASRHAPGEPVVVWSPYFYLPLRFELCDDADCRLLDPGRPLPHFDGAAALTSRDFVQPAEVERINAGRIWVVEGVGHAAALPLPAERWHRASQTSFFEGYAIRGGLTVIEYERSRESSHP